MHDEHHRSIGKNIMPLFTGRSGRYQGEQNWIADNNEALRLVIALRLEPSVGWSPGTLGDSFLNCSHGRRRGVLSTEGLAAAWAVGSPRSSCTNNASGEPRFSATSSATSAASLVTSFRQTRAVRIWRVTEIAFYGLQRCCYRRRDVAAPQIVSFGPALPKSTASPCSQAIGH